MLAGYKIKRKTQKSFYRTTGEGGTNSSLSNSNQSIKSGNGTVAAMLPLAMQYRLIFSTNIFFFLNILFLI